MNTNESERSYFRLTIFLLLHLGCGLVLLGLLLKHVPQYEKMFKDFGCKLPDMTIAVISLSRITSKYWFLLAPLLAAADIGIMVGLHRAGRKGLLMAWGVLIWLAEMLLAALILLAVLIPMNDLMMHLSK